MIYKLVRSRAFNASLAVMLLVSTFLLSSSFLFAKPVSAATVNVKDYFEDKLIAAGSEESFDSLVNEVTEIVYSTRASDMESQLAKFQDGGEFGDEFHIVFGNDVSIEDFFTAFISYESYLRDEYTQTALMTAVITEGLTDFLKRTVSEAGQTDQLQEKIEENTGLTLDMLIQMKLRLDQEVEVDTVALMVELLEELKNQSPPATATTVSEYFEILEEAYANIDKETKDSLRDARTTIQAQNIVWTDVLGTMENPDTEDPDPVDPDPEEPGTTPGGGPSGGGGSPSDDDDNIDVGDFTVELDDVVTETNADGKKQATVTVDVDKITDIVDSEEEVDAVNITVPEDDDNEVAVVKVPAQAFTALQDKNPNATVNVTSKEGSYSLGVNEINVDEIAASLGASSSDDVEISIEISRSEDTDNTVSNNGLESASGVVEFKVTASVGGNSTELNNFASYVKRSITLAQGTTIQAVVDTDKMTAVRINEDGTLTAVPTVFEDGKATFRSKTNSKYTVVKNNKSFSDVSADYWAADSINKLGNKLIISGKEDGSYAPGEGTNRIQMTILLVKALGLTASGEYDNRFSDVAADAWYIEPLVAAVEAGIISGKEDGTFDPYSLVNRSQASAMLARGLEFAGFDEDKLDESKSLDQFADQAQIGDWIKTDVELMLEAGIFSGRDNGTIFDPNGTTTRAQTAIVLDNYLEFIEFIN